MMIKGAITALVTPFNKDGTIDEACYKRLLARQVSEGINGVVPCGTTGESATMTHKEHEHLIELTVKEIDGKVPVIAGAGSNSTSEALSLTKHAKDFGADAVLSVCPYYNKPTNNGILLHYSTIASKVDIPIIIYNVPGRTGKNIEPETVLKLAEEHSNIVAVKEASGSLPQMMDILLNKPKHFDVISGDDNLTVPLVYMGGIGIISVASNYIPKLITQMTQAALAHRWEEANRLHYQLLPFMKGIFIETNPVPIKGAMAMKGLIEENYRSPICPMSPENKEKLKRIMDKAGI
jgi:4-hydroxy-tetrahydrodipicolinate synthase